MRGERESALCGLGRQNGVGSQSRKRRDETPDLRTRQRRRHRNRRGGTNLRCRRRAGQSGEVFSADGKPIRSMGRAGGRTIVGPWTPDGMAFVKGIAVDSQGQVWAAEADFSPKRVSVWDGASGQFVRDFFGPPPYGATGGAIMPSDPNVMIGQGCEWRLDPVTGKSKCVAVITRDGMANSRFASGNGGRTYLAVASEWAFKPGHVTIYERVGEGQYTPRARFDYEGQDDKNKKTIYWADENGDQQPQENERTTLDGHLRFSGWWMKMSPDLAICTDNALIKVDRFTPCGAPNFDFAHATKIPLQSVASADGRLAMQSGEYNTEHGVMRCFDIASEKQLWSYPDNFVGVHGSHNACGPTRRHDSGQLYSGRLGQTARADRQRVGHSDQPRRMAHPDRTWLLPGQALRGRSPARTMARRSAARRHLR